MPGAAFEPLGNGGVRIVTATAPWHHAVGLRLGLGETVNVVVALAACSRGQVGLSILAEDGFPLGPPEETLTAGETRLVSFLVNPNGEPAGWLMVRNGADETASECNVSAVFTGGVPSVELTDREIQLALRDPVAANASCARRAWPEAVTDVTGAYGLPLQVHRPPAPVPVPPASAVWSGGMESVVLNAAEDLVKLLEGFQPEFLERHVAAMPKDSMRSCLRMNIVRVVRLVELLRRSGLESGAVLEVGAWFGSFAVALRRLGYDVVACDRYSSYGDAFDSYVELMESEGIRVVSTTRERELEQIAALGRFHVVLAGAVIEHVPHTPRYLLETLFGAARPGGFLFLDTPNVARYWNRRLLERGGTIFQPLADQYLCEPPWEGHHREYTATELKWILERVGCEDVHVEFLDYNMLQFDELSAEHIECLATIVEDPSQSDTLLAAGRRPIE
jgi:2-polyprenyl-3-methyl-5-hydroxy-6-metoxy-1,4-benzoquinol methylase